jgi:hypothetical protein
MSADEQIQQDREILAAAPKDSDDWDDAMWAAWWRTAERHDPHFARKLTTAAAVAAQGALPVPVGPELQAHRQCAALTRLEQYGQERGTYGNSAEKALHHIALDLRKELSDQLAYETRLREQHDLDVEMINRLRARVAELEVERHTTNEALSGAAETLRANRDRIAELADYEVMNPQQCQAGKHADWLVDSEYAHACPWCEVERLKAELTEAHQKKTAALTSARQLMNRNRTEEAS